MYVDDTAGSYTGDSASSLQAKVVTVEERLRRAMLDRDIHVLDELIAPELLFTNHFGQTVSKEADLAVQQSGTLRLTELAPSEQQIQMHSNFAVVSVLMHLVGTYQNVPIDQTIRYTRVWSIAPDGSMRIIAGHASAVVGV